MKKLLIVVCFLTLALAACGSDTGTTATQPTATTAPTSVPTATPTPHVAKWTTVQHFSGNGTKKTQIITVADDWKILWSCVGGEFGGVLVVTVYDSTNTYVDGAVNATCKVGSKATTGETEEHQAGNVYLSIDSTGDWSLQVQELK